MYIDCDVIQADGGTRTASITGSFVAMIDAFRSLKNDGIIDRIPAAEYVAAVSAGIVDGEVLLDLDYREDSQAEVDMNIIMTRSGRFIEVQGTAEQEPFSRDDLEKMMDVAFKGITELTDRQIEILGDLN
jgi:ribonuclease PH